MLRRKIQPEITVLVITTLVFSLVLGGGAGFYGASLWSQFNRTDVGRDFTSRQPLEINDQGEVQVPPSVISDEQLTIDTVSRASQSVASIVVSVDQQVYERSVEQIAPFGSDSPFVFQIPKLKSVGTERQVIGGGSGFFVSSDGLIITNRHVVLREDAFYTVVTSDGKEYEAAVVDRDPFNDLAVLKVENNSFPALTLGDSDEIRVGQRVIAIGYALGKFSNTVSVGIVSGLGRDIRASTLRGQVELLSDLIQTDAAINQGNSGGPLLDIHGQVIGVNTAVVQGSENIGFAIPINAVGPVIASVKEHGRIVRPMLGVRYVMLTPEISEKNDLPVDYGAIIIAGDNTAPAVLPESPAKAIGLRERDIILELGGQRLDAEYTLGDAIVEHNVGDVVSLKILRGDIELTLEVTLAEWQR